MDFGSKRILGSIFILLIGMAGVSFLSQGTPWLLFMAFLGATIGIPMGLVFPFPPVEKALYISAVLLSAGMFLWGIRHRSSVLGQSLAVVGLVVWTVVGVIGLGAGT